MNLTKDQYTEAKTMGLSAYWHKISGFAEACFDQNSFADLRNFQTAKADAADCAEWGITEDEWRRCQEKAIELAMACYEDEHGSA